MKTDTEVSEAEPCPTFDLEMPRALPFRILLCVALSAVVHGAFAQEKFTISGYISDQRTGETILGASVYDKASGKGTVTNLYGFYSLTLPAGTYTIVYSFIGYATVEKEIELNSDVQIDLELGLGAIVTEVAEVVGEQNSNTESTDMGRVELEVEKIKKLPALLGEVDVLKTIQFLPGVQSAGEGNSGFYVRGGGPDQNLVLLDNATVYNVSHLFGFFSVFNADAVKNIELIKGGMPANYGGRVSSVLDIALKEGNSKELKVHGGIGLISSRATIEGPIVKDKASFIVSGRRTYVDVLARPFINPESNFAGSGYFFYDLNTKMNWKISNKDKLFLSGYFGRDVFNFSSAQAGFTTRIPWGNATASLRWNHLFSDKLFWNTIATYSDYQFAFEASQDDFEFGVSSGIEDVGFKSQLSWFPSLRHSVKAGVEYTFHEFTPNNVSASSGDVAFDTGEFTRLYSHEAAVFLLDDFVVNDQLKINAGARLSYFAHVGPYTKYIPIESSSPQLAGTREAIEFGRGDLLGDYVRFEPRVAMRYTLNSRSSIKAGYTHNYQYLHLTSLSATSLPTDVWVPSTDDVAPQFGVQYSIGYFRNTADNVWEGSIELYYKDLDNLVEYQENTRPEDNINNNIDNFLTFGVGYSYGAEFFLKKRTGDLNGWIGYTWSKTMRQFDEINNGEEYPAKFDRRHDLSVILNYELNDKWSFGGAFVFATGQAITLPVERYFYEGRIVDVFGERNSFRMAPYHRADISATYTPPTTREELDPVSGEVIVRDIKFTSSLAFSVYNLYNRQNPYFIYFGNEGELAQGTLDITAYQVSLFPILPSVTWNFNF